MIKFFIVFCIFSLTLTQDCGTPLQCYEKAIQLMTQERQKFESTAEILNSRIANLTAKNEDLQKQLDSLNGNFSSKNGDFQNQINTVIATLNSKDQDFQNQLNADVQNLQNSCVTINNRIDSLRNTLRLECSPVSASGHFATCPPGSIVASCSCGSACGSWDIQGANNVCHCQCGSTDWTAAQCCRIIS